ncbi:MAG: hypothetical protein O7E52_29765 [Candidatus Poribacteria bacterium]|nr:hypothetical protein [Candidatus Poribacteria bacterium]
MKENKPSHLRDPGLTPEYIDKCRHPAIQRLKPELDGSDLVWTSADRLMLVAEAGNPAGHIWLPTLDQLLCLLRERCDNPNEPILRPCEGGWECIVTISEWTADYGTFVDAQRRFVGENPKLVVLRALKAAIGAGERWMVGNAANGQMDESGS